jgi:hypothetical protein
MKVCLKGNRQSLFKSKVRLRNGLAMKVQFSSVIVLVEDIIHEQVATVQRSTWELSDLVDIISV